MDLLELSLGHSNSSDARVQSAYDDGLNEVVVIGVRAQSCYAGCVSANESKFAQSRMEVVAQRGDVTERVRTDEVLTESTNVPLSRCNSLARRISAQLRETRLEPSWQRMHRTPERQSTSLTGPKKSSLSLCARSVEQLTDFI
jgi:hypothetical protein